MHCFAVKAVCDNESRKRKRSREDPGYSIMRSDDGNMSFQVSRSRRVDKGRGGRKIQHVGEGFKC